MKTLVAVLMFGVVVGCTGGVGASGPFGPESTPVNAGECNCAVTGALDDAGVMDAGADAGVPVLASGTRLRIIYNVSVDGLRVPQSATEFYDVEKQLKCTITDVLSVQGSVRICIPTLGPRRALYVFEDAACTQKLVFTDPATTSVPYVKIISSGGIRGVNTLGDEYTGSSVYSNSGDGTSCDPFDTSTVPLGRERFYRVGDDVTATFVLITEQIDGM